MKEPVGEPSQAPTHKESVVSPYYARAMMVRKSLSDWKANRQKFAAAMALLKDIDNFFEHAPLETGICHCGDYVRNHLSGSDHAPVDMIGSTVDDYHAEIKKLLNDKAR